MLPPELLRIFISYARKDGADLDRRLQGDLKVQRAFPDGIVWISGGQERKRDSDCSASYKGAH